MSALDKDTWRITFGEVKAAAEDIIEEARRGRMFILVDDEDRENEGDLVIPAQCATPEAINFMAKHARGLICLALTRDRVEQLGLPLMAQNNGTRHQTAFTVSIEAREGVTTGISAADRARTVAVAIDRSCGPQDIVTPGHVFPLVARDGGVLERTGHTEAAVDLARLAGLTPAGVICEIMNDDGTMARRNDLITFAQRHGLKIGTISDLIAYRRRYDSIIRRISETNLDSIYGGDFRCVVYLNKVTKAQHVALVKGDPSTGGPITVRMHAVNLFTDTLGHANQLDDIPVTRCEGDIISANPRNTFAGDGGTDEGRAETQCGQDRHFGRGVVALHVGGGVGLSEAQRQAAGISQGLIRLAVGLEHVDDICDDLQRGLATLNTL